MRCYLRPGAWLVCAAVLPFVFVSSAAVGVMPSAAAAVRSSMAVSAGPAPSTIVGVACPDVMVIAARGTDEAPSNADWQDPTAYTSDQYKGAGQTLYTMYGQLVSANPNLKISLYPVGYPTSLPSGKNGLLALATQTADYLNDADIGADGIVEDIQSTDIACGGSVSYVLAGYSLGAWAVHDALHQLATQKKLGEIDGVALFGDPKFEPGQPFVRDFASQDTYHGVAYYAIEQADNAIPPAVASRTGSWCLPADPICQFQYDHIQTWTTELGYCVRGKGACAHFQYPTDGETLNAAAFLQPFLHPAWASVSGGYDATCAIRTDRTLWCWGNNAYGELGTGSTTSELSPVQVGTSAGWASVSVGQESVCGTRTDGTLWCWGQNYSGQLGTGDTTVHLSPVQVGTSANWASVSVSYSGACAIRTDRTLWCWGSNLYGQLGLGNYTDQHSPAQVGTAASWATVSNQVAATACATRTDGTLWCWGDNTEGELGIGSTISQPSPVQVGTATTWATVSTDGSLYTCATRTNGTLWCWGDNTFGELGTSNTVSELSPVRVGSAANWVSVSAGNGANTCALRAGGALWCWGANYGGELGNGNSTQELSPVQIGTATSWTSVARGEGSGCATQADHTLWCWGNNFFGQLGLGDTTDRLTPTEVG